MGEMEYRFNLSKYGSHLWTRPKAREVKSYLLNELEKNQVGDTLIIDTQGVEIFDYSFANELFGKIQLNLATEYSGRFIVIENLNAHTRENLIKGLEELNLMAIERRGEQIKLIGKTHPTDQTTFETILRLKDPVTANQLKEHLGLNINAMNERLSKLAGFGIIRREKATSQAGREQFVYSALR